MTNIVNQIVKLKCGAPKHSERSNLEGWSDEFLVEIANVTNILDNPYRCEACGKLIQEEWESANNI